MSEIYAVQLTAVATLALAVLALVTAVLAGLAFLKQSREVGLLLEQNQRDTDERRRAQAARVFLGAPHTPGFPLSPYVRNASEFPIYDARIRYGTPDGGLSDPEYLGTVMPGDTTSAEHRFSDADEALKYTALTFRDAAGIRWIRWPDGALWEPNSRARLNLAIKLKLIAASATTPDEDDLLGRDTADSPQSVNRPLSRAERRAWERIANRASAKRNLIEPRQP